MGINRPVDDDIDFYFNNYKKNHDICRFKFTVERSDSTQLQLRLSCGGTGSYGRHIWIDRARIATHFIHGNGRTTASEWQFEVSAISSRLSGERYEWRKIFETSEDLESFLNIKRGYGYPCTITICIIYRLPSDTPDTSNHLSDLSTDLYEKLFLDEATSDVTLKVGEDVIPAHKLILSARVPYYEKLFSAGMKEAETNQIEVKDVDSKTMKQVIEFIYCGNLPHELQFDSLPQSQEQGREKHEAASSILQVAELYGIPALKEACSISLASALSKDNLVDTLLIADIYQLPNLKSACLQHLRDWKSSFETGAFDALKSHPELLIDAFESLACKPEQVNARRSYWTPDPYTNWPFAYPKDGDD